MEPCEVARMYVCKTVVGYVKITGIDFCVGVFWIFNSLTTAVDDRCFPAWLGAASEQTTTKLSRLIIYCKAHTTNTQPHFPNVALWVLGLRSNSSHVQNPEIVFHVSAMFEKKSAKIDLTMEFRE